MRMIRLIHHSKSMDGRKQRSGLRLCAPRAPCVPVRQGGVVRRIRTWARRVLGPLVVVLVSGHSFAGTFRGTVSFWFLRLAGYPRGNPHEELALM